MRSTKLPAALSSSLLLFALATGCAVVLAPSDAYAQDEEALQQARAKFQKALELEHAKNWGGALKLFREVGGIKMTPQVRYHIATCEENLGQLVTALGGYELALAQAEGMHPDFIAEVQGSIDDLKARIPKLVIERAEGSEAAQIQLDGVQIGESSIGDETPVDPGPHTVTANAPGYEDYQETVTVAEGAVEVIQVTLTKIPKGGSVGGTVGTDSGPKDFGPWPYVIGGIGAVSLVTGGSLLGVALSKHGKVKDLCGGDTTCDEVVGTDDEEEARKFSNQATSFEVGGWVGVGVGIVGIGAGVAMLVMSSGGEEADPSTAGVALKPYAPNSNAGLSLVGRF